jgi:hypothetical protein
MLIFSPLPQGSGLFFSDLLQGLRRRAPASLDRHLAMGMRLFMAAPEIASSLYFRLRSAIARRQVRIATGKTECKNSNQS